MTPKICVIAGVYCWMGLALPIPPLIVATIAVLIVRGLVWTRTKSLLWNVLVCVLATLGSIVSIEGHDYSIFQGFWIGVGYGAIGVGIVEIGKSAMFKALTERFASALAVLFGVKTPPTE